MSNGSIWAGRIQIYSAPVILMQHISWAINQQLAQVVDLTWVDQPLASGSKAVELEYKYHKTIAASLAIALKGWSYLRFEIREVNNLTQDGTYYRATPDLGLHQVSITSNGDVTLNENQVSAILKNSTSHEKLVSNLENALGSYWDDELEPYRVALATGVINKQSKSG